MKADGGATSLLVAKPLYGQVRDLVLGKIKQGEWAVGESLPNELALATQFGVSIGTVRRAIENLEECGVVKRVQGRGTYVTGQHGHSLREKFTTLRSRCGERIDVQYQTESIKREVMCEAVATALQVAPGSTVLSVRQLLLSQGQPIGLEQSSLPSSRLPRFETQIRFGQHIYPILADYGLLVTRAEKRLSLTCARDDLVDQLMVQDGEPLFEITRLAFAIDNSPIEHRIGLYVCSRVTVAGTIV